MSDVFDHVKKVLYTKFAFGKRVYNQFIGHLCSHDKTAGNTGCSANCYKPSSWNDRKFKDLLRAQGPILWMDLCSKLCAVTYFASEFILRKILDPDINAFEKTAKNLALYVPKRTIRLFSSRISVLLVFEEEFLCEWRTLSINSTLCSQ